MKPVTIQSQLSNEDIDTLAEEIGAAHSRTYYELGALFRRVLPRLLDGWTEDDIGELTIGEVEALPSYIARALERRQLHQLPPLTPPTA